MPVSVFICYVHEDERFLKKLRRYLRPLKIEGRIDVWDDQDISPAMEWEQEIKEHLDKANIILLLVSPDFIASDYLYSIEMRRAMKRYEEGKARVIPIILRPGFWEDAPFGGLHALPRDAKPVTMWSDEDEALRDVANGIREVIAQMNRESSSETPSSETPKRVGLVGDSRAIQPPQPMEPPSASEPPVPSTISMYPPAYGSNPPQNPPVGSRDSRATPPLASRRPSVAAVLGGILKKITAGRKDNMPQAQELSLFAIARTTVEDNDQAIVGKIYTIEAGIAQNPPEGFRGEPIRVRAENALDPLLFDILIHPGDNIELMGALYQRLRYYPGRAEPQFITCPFRLTAAGRGQLIIHFYRERQWLKAIHFEFEGILQPQPAAPMSWR